MKIDIPKSKIEMKKVKDSTDKLGVQHTLFSLPWRMLLIAKSGAGKNSILNNLLLSDNFKFNKVFTGPDIYIFAPNPYEDKKMEMIIEYYDIEPNNIYEGEDLDMENLKHVYEGLKDEFRMDRNKRPLLIIDDYSSSGKFSTRFNQLGKLFSNSRKFQINIVVLSQYYFDLSKSIRTNANILIIGNTSNKNLKEIAAEHNFLQSGKDSDFIKLFRSNTKNKHDFFTINYTSNNINELYLDNKFRPIEIIEEDD